MSKTFSVLVVGAGKIAGGFDMHRTESEPPLTHAKAYLQHGGFMLAAVAEPDFLLRDAFCNRWNIPEQYDSITALRHRVGEFDVISICSSTHSHDADLAAAIALRPRLIFCEKPVTTSVGNTRRWVEACDKEHISLAVAHLRRWAPDVVQLSEDLRNGRWGSIRSIHAIYNKGVINNGSHMLDLLQYLFGDISVTAVGHAIFDAVAEDPSVPALLETCDGIPITLNVAHMADYAHFELHIVTQQGTISMENGGARWRHREVIDSAVYSGYRELDRGKDSSGEVHLAFRYAIANLYLSLSEGSPLASTGRTALAAQTLCERLRDTALNDSKNTSA